MAQEPAAEPDLKSTIPEAQQEDPEAERAAACAAVAGLLGAMGVAAPNLQQAGASGQVRCPE
jgi:hypothetical protein